MSSNNNDLSILGMGGNFMEGYGLVGGGEDITNPYTQNIQQMLQNLYSLKQAISVTPPSLERRILTQQYRAMARALGIPARRKKKRVVKRKIVYRTKVVHRAKRKAPKKKGGRKRKVGRPRKK